MIKIIEEQTREELTTLFYEQVNRASQEYKDYIKIKYLDTGKLHYSQYSLNEDKTKLIKTSEWNDLDSFLEFVTDPYIIANFNWKQLNEYNIKNNISSDYKFDNV